MPITSPEDYELAQEYVAKGKASLKLMASMKAYEIQRDNDPHMSQQTSQQSPATAEAASREAHAQPEPPGKKGLWIPNRPLGVSDYIAADVGGKLNNWREMPLDEYKVKVLLPQREKLIRDGMAAQINLQKNGVGAFPPEALMQMTMAIAQGKAAEAQNPDSLTEEDPGYKQFNDQQWQQAVQQHSATPDAGPMQRVSKQSALARASDYVMGGTMAVGKGALNAMTLGLSNQLGPEISGKGAGQPDNRSAIDQWLNADARGTEAVGTPYMDKLKPMEDAHPVASFAGNALGMLAPGSAGGGLFRSIYGTTKAGLGSGAMSGLRAGALAGAGTAAAETAVEETGPHGDGVEGFLEHAPGRAVMGGAAGALGDGLAQGAGKLATKLDMNSVKRAGRPIFSWLEARGYKFSPIFGEISSPEAKAQLRLSAEDPMGRPVAQRISKNAGGPINDNVIATGEKLQGRQEQELEGYFRSVGASNKTVPITNTDAALADWLSKNSTAMEITAPIEKLYGNLMERVGWKPETAGIRPREMHSFMQQLSEAAKADNQLAGAYKAAQKGMMLDIESAPSVPGGPDWSTVRGHHNFENVRMERVRQDTGVRDNPEWDFANRDQQAGVRKKIETIGSPGARVETEQALKRFAPPEVRQELETLEAMNAARAHVNGPWTGLASDSGALKFLSGAAQPRIYGAARGLSREIVGDTPISEQLFTWINARAPRATMILQGMGQQQMAQLLAEQDAVNNRPKKFSDLTPEQVQVLNQALGAH